MRTTQRVASLAAVGLFAQRWALFRRHGSMTELERVHAELDASRQRARELEEELARTREGFDRRLSQVNDLFWTVEILPGGDATLTYLSADASGVLGAGVRAGLDAKALPEGLVHPDESEEHAAFTAAMLKGEPAEVEERLIGFDGVVRWTWSRGTPRREGDRLFVDGITTNITEHHQLAERREAVLAREREQVAMLEEMHRSRDDFIALAGHELRTPLTVVQGYAEHLLDDPTMGPEQRAQLEIVVRRARSMSELIDDLFDLAKLDASLTGVAFASVGLDEVVAESVKALRPTALHREIGFEVTTEPVHVVGDRARLRRMCDNVLDNAIRYGLPGTQVSISLAREDGEAVLVVADEGIGIPPDEVAHVFERLYRATNVVDRRLPGTGLGLSIALATVEGMGGTATAANGRDGGAVFTFRLPLDRSADQHVSRPAPR